MTRLPTATDDSRCGATRWIQELARRLWSGLRHMAWGLDAFARIQHGLDVPPDHPARAANAG